ncbi:MULTISPECIES: TolC family protein [unclassified Ensifer]|uniref:TolC family protein n=1 Tax=Ensifer sp. LC499 TaxID=1120654 RepID=UPI0009F32E67
MKRLTAAFTLLVATITADVAKAEPLSSALAKAHRNNPTLTAARAGVLVSAQDVEIARSAMRPTIKLRSGIGYSSVVSADRGTFGIVLDQTLFDGLQTTNTSRSTRRDCGLRRKTHATPNRISCSRRPKPTWT